VEGFPERVWKDGKAVFLSASGDGQRVMYPFVLRGQVSCSFQVSDGLTKLIKTMVGEPGIVIELCRHPTRCFDGLKRSECISESAITQGSRAIIELLYRLSVLCRRGDRALKKKYNCQQESGYDLFHPPTSSSMSGMMAEAMSNTSSLFSGEKEAGANRPRSHVSRK